MRVFCTPKGEDFESKIHYFNIYISRYIDLMEEELRFNINASGNRNYVNYIKYCRWPIRKLEYSYAVEKSVNHLFGKAKVLEAGCGVTPMPFFYGSFDCEVTAVDCSYDDIVLMNDIKNRGNFPGSKNVEFKIGDITKLEFEDNYFDVVSAISVLEHLDYPQYIQALAELYRVLKPDGVLICTVDTWNKASRRSYVFEGAFNNDDIQYLLSNFDNEIDEESADYRNFKISEIEIKKFWESHYTDGIGYSGDRGYTSVGFTVVKQDIKNIGLYNTVLTKKLFKSYLKHYYNDQVLVDLILLDYWAKKKDMPIVSSGRYNDQSYIVNRSFRLWEYRQIIKALEIDKFSKARILDLGGASCPITYYAALRGLELTSIDINPTIVENQKRVAISLGFDNINTILQDMRDLSVFQDNYFDMVMSASVYEHLSIDGQIKSMQEVYRVLKPGGRVAISFDYGIPSPNANEDLIPPHEPPVTSDDITQRFCDATGLRAIGDKFSNIIYPYWDTVYYSPAVLILQKPYEDGKAVKNIPNICKPWEVESSILYNRFYEVGLFSELMSTYLIYINDIHSQIEIVEKDREARLEIIKRIEKESQEKEARISDIEADREARLEIIKRMEKESQEKEARISEIEADREARLEIIKRMEKESQEKEARISEIEADREARLEIIKRMEKESQKKEARISEIEEHWDAKYNDVSSQLKLLNDSKTIKFLKVVRIIR